MIRHCIVSATDVRAIQRSDGSWTVEGMESEQFVDTILIAERITRPLNSTFYVTLKPNECIERLINNESDWSNLSMPHYNVSVDFYVNVAMYAGKNQFVTGYNISEEAESSKDLASVFTNFGLLEPEIYLWCFIFFTTCFAFIAIRVAILTQPSRKYRPSLARRVLRHASGVFYDRNQHFKLITLLYSVFCFYILTSFLCVYKTSHVIVERPFYPKSYEESLNFDTSLAGFFDQFVVVSNGFESALRDSLKGKLWSKLLASGRKDESAIDPEKTSFTQLPILMSQAAESIVVNRSIGIASSITVSLLKSLTCGFSPETQLWFIKIYSDPSEEEIIYGLPVATHFSGAHLVNRNLRRSLEGHILHHHFDQALDVTRIATRFAGTSRKHQWRQHLACNHEEALIPDVEVHALTVGYFHSFFLACLTVWTVAFILNLLQIHCTQI